jgi:hypothetical protein
MSVIYRKSLKGIDEVAFKSAGLPMRLASYLLVVDGESSIDQLAARHPQLPSLGVVLQGLMEQGFVEVMGKAANVVEMAQMRVGNGAPSYSAPAQRAPESVPAPSYYQPPAPAPAPQRASGQRVELDNYKANMVRDVAALLGSDAAQVIQKIHACQTRDDLFATMMGIKKIITMYTDRTAAEKFVARYQILAM